MIHVERLDFSVGSFALQDVTLDVAADEYFVLLGPSGSGKTLLLECLCGLNRIDSGRIVIGDVDVTRLEPRRRGIGYLPQDYALFPHLTVRRNIEFGLRTSPTEIEGIRSRVARLMELTGVHHLAGRLPRNLSGGEKQRVALARALAIRPQVLLLDEPVSALDEQTRDTLCGELKTLQRSTRTTTVHVCHNFAEMLAVADRVGIIHNGRILQVDTPRAILERPRNRFVARFVQAGNVLAARARDDGQWLRLCCGDGVELSAPRSYSKFVGKSGEAVFVVRPENVSLRADAFENAPPGTSVLQGVVRHLADLGPLVEITVICGPQLEFQVSLGRKEYDARRLDVGEHVRLAIAADDVHLLED